MRKPGDRKKVWRETCNIEGGILFLIGIAFMSTMCTAGIVWGGICIFTSAWCFRDAKNGPPFSEKRPPWADRHDAIDKKWAYKNQEKP